MAMAMAMDRDSRFSEWFKQQLQLGVLRDEPRLKKTEEVEEEDDFSKQVDESEESEAAGNDDDLENRISKIGGMESADDYDWGDCCFIEGPNTVENVERHTRSTLAANVWFLTEAYTFDQGVKICIPFGGKPIFGFSKECFESTWVAIHGMNSICMVTSQHLDMTRFPDFLQRDDMKPECLDHFASAVISEVECILHRDFDYYDADFRLLCTEINKKPLAVVSFGLGTFNETAGYEELVGCVSKTISFLESIVSSDSLDTHYGTIRAAIRAYQLMCLKELRAEDIWVTIMDVHSRLDDNLPIEIIREQLAISKHGQAPPPESEKHLFVYRINGHSESEKPVFVYRSNGPVTCD